MDEKITCPYCGALEVRPLDGIITLRLIERREGGPPEERECPLYRCLSCGRSFDEIEGGGGPDSETPELIR